MNEATFLEYHNNGVGKLLGITILSSAADRVVTEMQVSGEHMTAEDVVNGGIIMTMADTTAAYGAVLNMPEGCTTATIESKTNFLRKGTGVRLRAEAVPIHVGRTMSVWRTQVLRGGGKPIAEITQTQIYRPAESKAAAATQRQDRLVERAPGEASPANLTVFEGGPARTRRGATVEDRKRQIFEAACEVIAHKGFANASIREIALTAQMPVPTMYQYIEGKNDLLLILYQYFMEDVGQAMRKAVSPDLPPAQNLERVIRAMVEIFDVHQRYIRLMFQETKSLEPAARQKVFELDADNIAILKPLLLACKEAGECDFDDVEIAANLVYFQCAVWPLRRWTLKKHGFDAVGQAMTKFIMNGLTGRR
ncbi:MAG: hotdog fold thioesterase [bacterium]